MSELAKVLPFRPKRRYINEMDGVPFQTISMQSLGIAIETLAAISRQADALRADVETWHQDYEYPEIRGIEDPPTAE